MIFVPRWTGILYVIPDSYFCWYSTWSLLDSFSTSATFSYSYGSLYWVTLSILLRKLECFWMSSSSTILRKSENFIWYSTTEAELTRAVLWEGLREKQSCSPKVDDSASSFTIWYMNRGLIFWYWCSMCCTECLVKSSISPSLIRYMKSGFCPSWMTTCPRLNSQMVTCR